MRKTICGLLATSTLCAIACPARADTTGFAVDHFDPSERGSEWFALDSLDFRGHVRPVVGIVGDWAYQPLVATNANGNIVSAIVRNQANAHLGGSLVLWDTLRVGLNLPVQLYADGQSAVLDGTLFSPPAHATVMGDLRLDGDVRLLGKYGESVTVAAGLEVFIPTGDRASYASDGSIRVAPRALIAGDLGVFVYAAKVGVMIRALDMAFGPSEVGSNVFFGASAGVRVLDKKLVVGPELFGNSGFTGGAMLTERATPMEGMLGAHYLVGDQFRVGAGISTGLTGGYGTPTVRGVAMFEWAPPPPPPDRDHDGVSDADDACPDTRGDKSADPKANGCPPPAAPPPPPSDRDHDGIADTEDACPDVAGVKAEDPKTTGCPADQDKDGIVDTEDACMADPGVKTDDPHTNGCPPDRDHDGVLDRDDACPDVAGIKTADPATNGCPDPDRDKDGIKNEEDACPDEPGPRDPDPKRNGCPKAFVQNGEIKILDQVKFKTGSAEIVAGHESADVLNAVLDVLKSRPDIHKVRVEGHTDNRGSAAMNRKLSGDRAASVVKWLTAHGVEASRLVGAGFGPDRPLDSNLTEAGRKSNRRVEFHLEP